jgi:hypothetical protein
MKPTMAVRDHRPCPGRTRLQLPAAAFCAPAETERLVAVPLYAQPEADWIAGGQRTSCRVRRVEGKT